MSFQAWAASWSAYTFTTSGPIVPSSSSRAILLSTSADGASLIIAPDTRCFAVSSCDTGWVAETRWPPSFKTRERPLLCIATDQVKDNIHLLLQNLLELLFSIVDNPAGSEGVEIRLIVAACRSDDGGPGMRCQLHGIGAHSAGTTVDQDRLSLFQVTVGEGSRSLGGPEFLGLTASREHRPIGPMCREKTKVVLPGKWSRFKRKGSNPSYRRQWVSWAG